MQVTAQKASQQIQLIKELIKLAYPRRSHTGVRMRQQARQWGREWKRWLGFAWNFTYTISLDMLCWQCSNLFCHSRFCLVVLFTQNHGISSEDFWELFMMGHFVRWSMTASVCCCRCSTRCSMKNTRVMSRSSFARMNILSINRTSRTGNPSVRILLQLCQ